MAVSCVRHLWWWWGSSDTNVINLHIWERDQEMAKGQLYHVWDREHKFHSHGQNPTGWARARRVASLCRGIDMRACGQMSCRTYLLSIYQQGTEPSSPLITLPATPDPTFLHLTLPLFPVTDSSPFSSHCLYQINLCSSPSPINNSDVRVKLATSDLGTFEKEQNDYIMTKKPMIRCWGLCLPLLKLL